MLKSDSLRARKAQHLPKNTLSKGDDKKVANVMNRVIRHLDSRFKLSASVLLYETDDESVIGQAYSVSG